MLPQHHPWVGVHEPFWFDHGDFSLTILYVNHFVIVLKAFLHHLFVGLTNEFFIVCERYEDHLDR